jgi:hypothetical protein
MSGNAAIERNEAGIREWLAANRNDLSILAGSFGVMETKYPGHSDAFGGQFSHLA